MHIAAENGRTECVQMLLDRGASVDTAAKVDVRCAVGASFLIVT